MGLFLAMSGIAGADLDVVKNSLKSYAKEHDGRMEASPATAETWEFLIVSESQPGRITVAYPGEFMNWDDAAADLSRSLDVPVFSFHIHDDDLWMYVLFDKGEEIDCFNPIPAYWSNEMSDEEVAKWKGDPTLIAKQWPGVKPEAVEKYLVSWDLDDAAPGKAYPDDQFASGDCWQLTDFMRRLGLDYPIDDRGQAHGETYRFEVEE